MAITPLHHRIEPFPPLFIIPPLPEKPKPGEPVSLCAHLRRLMLIQQRNAVIARIMLAWTRMTTFLGFGVRGHAGRFSRLV